MRPIDHLKRASRNSIEDFREGMQKLTDNPQLPELASLLRTMTTSSFWIGRSYLDFISSKKKSYLEIVDDHHYEIMTGFFNKDPNIFKQFSNQDIFKAIYIDRINNHKNSFDCPYVKPTLVLVSGVFNEIFSTAAFERAAKHLKKKSGIKYIAPKVKGFESSKKNAEALRMQLENYIRSNPREKLWLIAFSKGGVDSLHYLHENKEFADRHIQGLSTIASPILGSNHLNHRLIKLMNSVHKLSDTEIYQFIDSRRDIFAKEFQKSLSAKHQESWFRKHYKELPESLFYTATAFKSDWQESHFWMILTKAIFQSNNINDGVVDIDRALFPQYFDAFNFGVLNGHHLVGTRSSTYNQEALLEAHIIFLHNQGLLD